MSALQNFAFEENLVRVIERDGEPWFVANDICNCLGLANARKAVADLDDDEKGVTTSDTLGGKQEMNIVSEPGVYRLVFRSRKEEAERFKRWLAHEVLPQIRKTGQYRSERSADQVEEEPLIASQRAALSMVTEARMIYGPARARALWEKLPALPSVPMSALTLAAREEGIPVQVLECLEHLATHPADADMRSVAELLKEDDEAARTALEVIGIRPTRDGLWLAAGKPEMRLIWEKTRWRDGLWVSILKKLPSVTGGHERMTIGGYQCRPIWLPASAFA